jgi:CDP-glucose 4,6-dehydratase
MLRNPNATRPFQSVRDVLRGYLLQVEHLALNRHDSPRAMNFGPSEQAIRVCDLLEAYGAARGRPVVWHPVALRTYSEAPRLGLDSTLAATVLGWKPAQTATTLLAETAIWQETLSTGGNVMELARSWIATDADTPVISAA